MAGNRLTKFQSKRTIISSNFLNKIFGGSYGSEGSDSLNDNDPLVAGHKHDGVHADGHAQKIDLAEHTTDISDLDEKVAPSSTDLLFIEDLDDNGAKKKIQVGAILGAGTDNNAIHDNVAGEIAAIATKASPVVGDFLLIEDSAAANAKKKIVIGSLPGGAAESLSATLVAGSTTGGTDLVVSASDAIRFTEGTGPVTGINQIGIWNSNGVAADENPNTLYAIHESSGEQMPLAGANVFVYRPGGTAGGQIYTDMEKAYAAVLAAASSTAPVGRTNIQEVYPSTVFIIDTDTLPARPANAAYDLSNVTLVPTTRYPNTFTIADGVNFSGADTIFRGIPFISGSFPEVVAECITTSLYSGPAPEYMVWRRLYPFKTGPAATVPAFDCSGPSPLFVLETHEQTIVSDAGAAKVFSLSGGATINVQMYENSVIDGNPFEDDGGGDETISLGFFDPSSTVLNAGNPYSPTLGTTAAVTVYGAAETQITRTLYVDGGSTDPTPETGSSTHPYKTVQAAVDYAEANLTPSRATPVTIMVASQPGIYYDETVVIRSGITLNGGGGIWGGATIRNVIVTNATVASVATFIANGGLTDPAANYSDLIADVGTPTDFAAFRSINFGESGTPGEVGILIAGVGAGCTLGSWEINFTLCACDGFSYYRTMRHMHMVDCTLWGTFHTMVNLESFIMEGGQVAAPFTVDWDTGLDLPGSPQAGLNGVGVYFSAPITLQNEGALGITDPVFGIGFTNCRLNGNVGTALVMNDTSSARLEGCYLHGNVTVAGDATIDARNTHVQGNITLDNTGGAVACTMDGGEYTGVLTDTGSRLTTSLTSNDAIHDNVSGEINAVTTKVTPVAGDVLLIEDSADSFSKKKILYSSLAATDADAIHTNVSGEIDGLTEKTSLVSTDLLIIEDSEDSNSKKKVQLGSFLDAQVSAKTTAYVVLTADQGSLFTNEGAAVEIDFTLPAAATGLGPYHFYNQDTDGLRVIAGAGDTIRIGVGAGAITAAAGNIKPQNPTDVGAFVTLVSINSTEWIAMSLNGSWTAT